MRVSCTVPRQPFYREQFYWDRLHDRRPLILPDGGDAPVSWVFVSDLAEACVRPVEVPEAAGEAFNVGHMERLAQCTFVQALACRGPDRDVRADVRDRIYAAGGHPFAGNRYFGEFLDIPPHTSVIEKASRIGARLTICLRIVS